MKKFFVNWQKEVRLDCTAWIEAETKEQAFEKFKNGEYEDYDEHEASVIDEDETVLDDVTELKED